MIFRPRTSRPRGYENTGYENTGYDSSVRRNPRVQNYLRRKIRIQVPESKKYTLLFWVYWHKNIKQAVVFELKLYDFNDQVISVKCATTLKWDGKKSARSAEFFK
jgi:hypothetical protein